MKRLGATELNLSKGSMTDCEIVYRCNALAVGVSDTHAIIRIIRPVGGSSIGHRRSICSVKFGKE